MVYFHNFINNPLCIMLNFVFVSCLRGWTRDSCETGKTDNEPRTRNSGERPDVDNVDIKVCLKSPVIKK